MSNTNLMKYPAGPREALALEFVKRSLDAIEGLELVLCQLGEHNRPPRRGIWPLLRRCKTCGRRCV